MDISYDNGGSWSALSGANPITLSTTAQSGEVYLPVSVTRQDLANVNATYAPKVRLTGTIAGAGVSPTITVSSVEVAAGKL